MASVTALQAQDALRPLSLKDMRQQCRARGLNPGGSQEALRSRLEEHMLATNNASIFTVLADNEEDTAGGNLSANNYARPGGNQNLGNRITGRSSSRVNAPPGGASQIVLGSMDTAAAVAPIRVNDPITHEAAMENLRKMGLGDTDALVADNPLPTPSARTPTARGQGNVSQLAFGDHTLPTTDAAEKEFLSRPTPAASAGAPDMDPVKLAVDSAIRPLMLRDLRVQLRARGLNPAGSLDSLRQRLTEHMLATGDLTIFAENGAAVGTAPAIAGASTEQVHHGSLANNYARPSGQQNVGNFITDRSSSRVLAPPGGGSQISFGDYSPARANVPPPAAPAPYAHAPAPYAQLPSAPAAAHSPYVHAPAPYAQLPSAAPMSPGNGAYGAGNNYSRPNGQQNVGNFITDRPTSRVLAPPGGRSQITFG